MHVAAPQCGDGALYHMLLLQCWGVIMMPQAMFMSPGGEMFSQSYHLQGNCSSVPTFWRQREF